MPTYSASSARAVQTDNAPYYSGFRDAVNGAMMQERNMDIVTNNLANAATPGFKVDRLSFNDFMTREVRTYFEQGPFKSTDSALDVAIGGEGFFQVQTPRGVRLTRNGSFNMTAQGDLVTSRGYKVLGDGGAGITLNPEGPKPTITSEGLIYQGAEQVGRIALVRVNDTATLEKEGANLYASAGQKALQTVPDTESTLYQGVLEESNVKVVRQMVNMIASFRAFESYQKAIRAMGEMDSKAATQVGRVA